jgi:hypothetical protein
MTRRMIDRLIFAIRKVDRDALRIAPIVVAAIPADIK